MVAITLAAGTGSVGTADLGAGLLNPPVMFFFLGALAALVKSNLRVPKDVTKLLSLYLLWSIGFQGGVKLVQSGLSGEALTALGLAVLLACVIPFTSHLLLRRLVNIENASALAAAYGSVSAVTFMTACTVLEGTGLPVGGHMVAAMALMESPAIVIGVLLYRRSEHPPKVADPAGASAPGTPAARAGWGRLLHEAFLNGPVLLLLGSMLIGMVTGTRGYQMFKPLCTDVFSGVLVFFLLDLGLLAARRLRALREAGLGLVAFGLLAPPVHAGLALALAAVCGLSVSDGVLLMVLAASASYIAVPAAMRLVIPRADPGLYVSLPLAVTFPFNIAVGLPLYLWAARAVLG